MPFLTKKPEPALTGGKIWEGLVIDDYYAISEVA